MKIRVKFGKDGDLKFVGHLDIMHYFQKALRRADIPICYSAGFSPHQIMSFASPLGLGLTSEGEYMDIEVSESGSSEEMVSRLNAQMVDGARVYSWRRLPDDSKNAMASIAAADYRVRFRPGYEPQDQTTFLKEFSDFCKGTCIMAERHSKRSVKELNIRPLIYECRAGKDDIFLRLAAGSVNHLKPETVFEAFYTQNGLKLAPFALMIHRIEIYTDLGDEAGHQFTSLEDMGEEIR